jgi:hypothetical protein
MRPKKPIIEFQEGCSNLYLRKHLSSTSTIDSPLISPKKSTTSDEELTDEAACDSFEVIGHCQYGDKCEKEHNQSEHRPSHSFILNNYPELVAYRNARRIQSFLN